MNRLVRRRPLIAFFALAYGISWLAAIPYSIGLFPVPIFPFGPLAAALVVAALVDGRAGVKSLLAQLVKWRAAPRWYALALLLPLGVTLVAAFANVFFFGAPDPRPSLLATLPMALPMFVLALLSPLQGALGEELGWRGYATPSLQTRLSPVAASLLLGILVAGWHAPLFLTGLYGDVALRVAFIVTTTLLYTLLYNGSGGSVFLAMLFHASWNGAADFILAPFAGADLERALSLYFIGGIAAAAIAAALAAPQLSGRRATVAHDPTGATV
jgi:membrane protease YdiL (CAAX protease family)